MSELRAGLVICSDRATAGQRADQTAAPLARMLEENHVAVTEQLLVADEQAGIETALRNLARNNDVVLTSGGTGIGARDCTVEATLAVIDRELPGFGEVMRTRSFDKVPTSILSRGTAGVYGSTLIVNLPGSPKGALECLEWVFPAIRHGVKLLQDRVEDCQSETLRRP